MKTTTLLSVSLLTFTSLLTTTSAQVVVSLGSASTFGVLGNTTVTNTGSTVITGDLGVSPGTAITGFPPGLVIDGSIHSADTAANQAHADAVTAFDVLAGEAFTQDMTGLNLGGRTLTTGVYFYTAAAELTGTLTLDALGDSGARFDFQTGSTLTTAIASQILLINGARAENVYWQIGSSATFLASSSLAGSFLASASITAGAGTVVDGRLLALNGAVTLDTNTISIPAAVPEPAATTALVAGLIGLVVGIRRSRPTPRAQPAT